ncbi:hypothetical protein ACFWN7_13735 [Agromyces sp. NPDC058484]|uniref:hypothetical protein n=1 Tax=Agromyces sp. NPDC058484 TaxID=3346524 RepID=UPI003666EDE3
MTRSKTAAVIRRNPAHRRRLGQSQSTHSVEGATFFATPGPIMALWSSAELAVDVGRASAADAPSPLRSELSPSPSNSTRATRSTAARWS